MDDTIGIEYKDMLGTIISTIPGDDEVGTVVVYIPVLVDTGGTVLMVSCGSISIVVVMAGLGNVTCVPKDNLKLLYYVLQSHDHLY